MIIFTSSLYFKVVLILLTKLISIKMKLSKIQIEKVSLQKRAKLIIRRFSGTHIDSHKFLALDLNINDEV